MLFLNKGFHSTYCTVRFALQALAMRETNSHQSRHVFHGAYILCESRVDLGSVSSRCSGMSPRSPPPPRKTAGRVRSAFVQIDQSGIRLPRLSRRNNYINYLCLHFRIHFIFFTWYLLRTFSGMFCVTNIAFYVLQKLTDFLAKQNPDLLQSAREYS